VDGRDIAVKIKSVEIVPYSLPFMTSMHTSSGYFANRQGYWLLLHDDDNRMGTGDIAPWPGFGSGPYEVSQFLQTPGLASLLQERTFESTDAISALLLGLPPEVAYGVELALLDLLGQEKNLSIARLLVSNPASQIEASMLVDNALQARGAVESGVTTVKVKIAHAIHLDPLVNLSPDLARIAAIREAIGHETRLRLDVNGGWTVEHALTALKILRRYGLEWIEQPVAADHLEGMARIRAESHVAVAVDESLRRAEDLERIVQLGAADAAVLKPMFLGGLLATLRVAQQACSLGLQVVVTHALESSIGRFGAVHVAAALAGTSIDLLKACGLSGSLVNDVSPGPEILFGWIDVPQTPGLGLPNVPDWQAVKRGGMG
jgi:o-succinylbenzoate synthase